MQQRRAGDNLHRDDAAIGINQSIDAHITRNVLRLCHRRVNWRHGRNHPRWSDLAAERNRGCGSSWLVRSVRKIPAQGNFRRGHRVAAQLEGGLDCAICQYICRAADFRLSQANFPERWLLWLWFDDLDGVLRYRASV